KNLRSDIAASGAGIMAAGMGNGVMKPVGSDGFVDSFFGVPTYTNTLAATASSDKVGAHFTDGNANPAAAATGIAVAWMPRMSMLNQPSFSGGAQIAVTMAYGMTEKQDLAYVKDVTIA